MSVYHTTLRRRQPVAEGTQAFHFDKPAGFDFRPGQAIDLILPLPGVAADSQDARHAFSIVSAPHENELVVATRMRDSAYKRALGALPDGAAVQVDGPFGALTLHRNPARAGVLIAGGIGITPFMSMLRHAAHQQTPQDLLLLYSNRRPEDTAFLAELQQLAQANPRFRLAATMTEMGRSSQPWRGETRVIDSALIRQQTAGLPAPIFYVSGPPGLVQAMQQTLVAAGVDEDDVRSEEFYGY
jgi:ferredoxin-NADP reductase